ncbi:GNAT family N-acetyltransferase [Hyphomonas sp.]|uniref:GNAT family N-acetyltransferase n=1 Tax=Hyphomonas sp. TaxID=87 RepID=UPI0025C5812B|nr:GNAT family N-acetyltransferase [Hyphomonas sp.]MBI1398996.1 GNAT family N-acetyltransferase [Hyphomonas sp.]
MSMRRLPEGYWISGAAVDEIPALIAVDLASGQLFAGTGLLPESEEDDFVPADVYGAAIPAGHVFAARDRKGKPVGFALTSVRDGSLYLDQISVDPAHGRKGLGAALVRRVVRDARDRRLKSVTLSTFRDVAWNGPFYRSLGFREVARRKMTAWMLELEGIQAEKGLDVDKRCFMARRSGWL